jgi:hypothetical protein
MFKVYKVELPRAYEIDGRLTNKEHLNSVDELNEWIANAYTVKHWPTIRVESDRTQTNVTLTDNGEWYVEA